MEHQFTRDDLTYIVTKLRDRLVAAENTIAELKDAVHLLNFNSLMQQRTIMALQGHLTPEGVAILASMEDAQLDPEWWNAIPSYVAFSKELEQALARRKPATE